MNMRLFILTTALCLTSFLPNQVFTMERIEQSKQSLKRYTQEEWRTLTQEQKIDYMAKPGKRPYRHIPFVPQRARKR